MLRPDLAQPPERQSFTTAELSVARRRKRVAFTTVELLIVIAVIAILVGFLFFAGQKMIRSNRINATRGTLNNLQGMLGELEAASGLQGQPTGWLWADKTTLKLVSPNAADTNYPGYAVTFWKTPYRVDNVATGPFDPLAAPTLLSEEKENVTFNARNGSVAVVNTSLAMSLIGANPANRSRLQQLPEEQRFVISWAPGNPPSPMGSSIVMPGSDHFIASVVPNNLLGDDSTADLRYLQGVHVKYQDHYFVGTGSLNGGTNPAPVVGTTSNAPWLDETAAPYHVPMLKDAWGNPIIFVPASGLRVRLLRDKSKLDPADVTQNWIVVSPEGEVIDNGSATTPPSVARLGRPFFASAGPDGDFNAGDDNLYSFEK